MSRFLSHLDMELMWDDRGLPLVNRDEKQLFQLISDMAYQSDVAAMLIIVPSGFVTDLASVPRIPFIYEALGDMAQQPAVVHDYCYSKGIVSRVIADAVLREAMELTGIQHWKAQAFYLGVRMGGASHYNSAAQ